MECDTLRSIVSLGLKLGSRECEWAPIDHDRPDRHVECNGTIEWSETSNEDYTGPHWVATCVSCGVVPESQVVTTNEHCPGSRRPIR